MKRYTGQKALYEAINRSRAKARRGGILERLLPESAKQEKGPVPAGPPPSESKDAPVEPPTENEPSRPVWERLYEAVAGPENAELQQIEKVEETDMPAQEPAVLPGEANREIGGPRDSRPQAMEGADLAAPARNIGSPNAVHRVRGALPMWWRLKPLQLNEGRVEISVSYHVAIAVALVVILVILAGFRLGQRYSRAKAGAPVQTNAFGRAPVPNAATEMTAPTRSPTAQRVSGPGAGPKTLPTGTQEAASAAAGTAQPSGDNWIVLATHKNRADLEAVKDHFAKNGISLAIYELEWLRQYLNQYGFTAAGLPSGDGFLLVTNDFYVNPQSPGTEGYKMIQKIASVGATYKAPRGRDPFTPRLFSDAYGMKISRMK